MLKTKLTLLIILGHVIVTKYACIAKQHDKTFMAFI